MSLERSPQVEKHFGSEPFPTKPLFGAIGLVLLALAVVTTARVTRVGTPSPADPSADVAAQRDLRFEDRQDGSIVVYDSNSGRLVSTIAPGSNNFMRGTLRALVRERHLDSIGREQPFRLTARRDGHLLLTDPATARTIDLGSFGPTNATAFAQLLLAEETAREDAPTQTASVAAAKP